MEARREALSLLNWEEGVALPVANAENKLLEEDIARKAIDRNRFQSELTEHSSKANALRDHIKYVKDELHSTQVNLLKLYDKSGILSIFTIMFSYLIYRVF